MNYAKADDVRNLTCELPYLDHGIRSFSGHVVNSILVTEPVRTFDLRRMSTRCENKCGRY